MDRVLTGNMEEILRSLETGIREYMDSEAYKTYLKAVSKFHDYSSNNILLIAMQKPEARLVAGYSTWKNSFRRNVKKGEKGIKIIAPMPVTVEKEKEKTDEFGNVKTEKVYVTVPRFKAVTVFDISQTEGEPLPDIAPEELSDDVRDYPALLRALESASPVPVIYADIEGSAKGYYHSLNDEIYIQRDMSQTQTVKTLVHEMAHSLLHTRENGGALIPQKTKEIQAESIAYAVCTHFGIDTSDYSFLYVTAWSSEQDLKTLRSSMDVIKNTASDLIVQIEGRFAEIKREEPVLSGNERKDSEWERS